MEGQRKLFLGLPLISITPLQFGFVIGRDRSVITVPLYQSLSVGDRIAITHSEVCEYTDESYIAVRYVERIEELPSITDDENYYNIWLTPFKLVDERLGLSGVQNKNNLD